jgi:hypothetical protein
MDASQFAKFWQLQGHRIIETKSCFWYDRHAFAFLSIPYHRIVEASAWELMTVFATGPSILARYPAPPEGDGRDSWLFVCTDRNYDLDSLEKKARNQTRRGIEKCKIEHLDFEYAAQHGVTLNEETLGRQGRAMRNFSPEDWRRYCRAANSVLDFEVWGAFVGGKLAALMVIALVEDCVSILHQSSRNDCLEYYPNNALLFTVTKQKLRLPGVGSVSYGLSSIDQTPGLERFKFNMGFVKKAFQKRLVINPIVRPVLVLGGQKLITKIASNRREDDFWRRASEVVNQSAS